MDADLDTLATALYVTTDDLLKAHPERVPPRPKVGFGTRITDAELITLAVMQAMLRFTSETHWLRYAHKHLLDMFPDLPQQSGYCKRLKKLSATMRWLCTELAMQTSLWTDDVWVVDSTPVECARSRETVQRCDMAGWAEYGYCASHSRFFWGLRLHLVTTVHGLPVGWVLTGAKTDERAAFEAILDHTPGLADLAVGKTLISDKNYYGRQFEADLDNCGVNLLRPTRRREKPRPGQQFLKPLRQVIESVNDTFKGQLDLEEHGGRTPAGVITRITQRVLALVAAIWHNDRIGAGIYRSLIAYDH